MNKITLNTSAVLIH